jgi:inorganic pyrophosphatase
MMFGIRDESLCPGVQQSARYRTGSLLSRENTIPDTLNFTVFRYDFGFVPSTDAEDGDPIDVLVLIDALPGCVRTCPPIGVIEGEQSNKKDKERAK